MTCKDCGLRESLHLCRQCHNAECDAQFAAAEGYIEDLKRSLERVSKENIDLRALNSPYVTASPPLAD